MMQFTLTVRYPDGTGGREQYDLTGMKVQVKELAKLLDALAPGEVVEIKRIS
jgi:hypothetical protein